MTGRIVMVADRSEADRWVTDRAATGRRERDLAALPAAPWELGDRKWVSVAVVEDADDVASALLAGLRGVDVAAVAPDDPLLRELLVDEIARATGTSVAADAAASAAPRPRVDLDPETVELLTVLGGGASMAEAAAAVHVSLRTAERRVGAARRALGVRTTAEAVLLVVGAAG